MRFRPAFGDATVYGAIVCLGAALLLAAYLLVMDSVDRLVRKDAEDTAQHWITYFASAIEDIDRIAAGEPPSAKSAETFEELSRIATIFRFKIFDRDGTLRLVSDEPPGSADQVPSLATHNATAAEVLREGKPFTEVKNGTPPDRPPLYAETYLPVKVDGKTVAIAEVYLDQTAKRALYRQSTVFTALLVAFVVAGAFMLPASGFAWRSRQKRRSDEEARFLARHDAMTGLLNRNAFIELMGEAAQDHAASERRLAIHFIDLDGLKETNDARGEDAGDRVIRQVAERLRAIVKAGDIVARTGGDEFAIAQTGISDDEEIAAFADRILSEIRRRPVQIGEDGLNVAVSVGVAAMPDDSPDATQLLKHAELALARMKIDGGDGWRRFAPEMDAELAARRQLEGFVRKATNEQAFELHFQPLYDARSIRLAGFEALLRLPAGEGAHVSPADFVPVAERLGLINKIGAWVIEYACEVAASWPEELSVAVNLSPTQFEDGRLVGTIHDALRRSGLAATRLEVEITEGLILNNTEQVLRQLTELKQIGVSIVLDDFGTGYSSLSYLWKFPLDKIKIDRSFLAANHEPGAEITKILRTIVALGHSLNMQVTAEGIETEEQAAFMRMLACDRLQGFHFSRPVPEADIARMVIRDFTEPKSDTGSGETAKAAAGNVRRFVPRDAAKGA